MTNDFAAGAALMTHDRRARGLATIRDSSFVIRHCPSAAAQLARRHA
jgi:hypothetical protein